MSFRLGQEHRSTFRSDVISRETCKLCLQGCLVPSEKYCEDFEYLTVDNTKILVHTFVICRLDNCNSLLVGSPKYLFQKLQRIQNCAVRLVAELPKAARTSPILQKLHWLPVEQRVIFKVLLLTYKALNNLAPVYISNLLVQYEPSRNLRSTDKYLLRIPQTHLKTYGDRAFSVAVPRVWNAYPWR